METKSSDMELKTTTAPMELSEPNTAGLSLDDDDDKKQTMDVYVGPEGKEAKFVIPVKDLSISVLFQKIVEEDKEAKEIRFPQVGAMEFEAMLPYLKHHGGVPGEIIPFPCRSKVMKEVCKDAWDAAYIDEVWDTNRDTLYKIMLAANYLDIKCLLHLACCKVASLVKGTEYDKLAETILPKSMMSSVQKK